MEPRSTVLPAAGLLSVALATSIIAPHAAALPSPQSDSWATLKIVNNLASETEYFGVNVTDEQIWLLLHKDPGGVTYENLEVPPQKISLTGGGWVQLSQIKDGKLYTSAGNSNGAMYAVIHGGGSHPTHEPVPVPGCPGGGCITSDYAYAALEWNFSVTDYQNINAQNIDQFSFPNRITVRDLDDAIQARSGFNGATNAEDILKEIEEAYTSSNCIYPDPANYPFQPSGCWNNPPSVTCQGLPRNYTKALPAEMGRMTQKIEVQTELGPSRTPFRWIGSSKGQMQSIPGRFTAVLQLFGASFEGYLEALYNGSPNSGDGYYMDYSSDGGYSFHMKVTPGEHGYHGLELSKIHVDTGQSGDMVVDRNAGFLLTAKEGSVAVTILANGASITDQPMGCPVNPPVNMNQYGLWTDRVIVTGATPDCNGVFGDGPVITTNISDHTSPENQGLIASMIGTVSTALNFGIIDPTWDPQDGQTGTSAIFQNVNSHTQSDYLFQQNASGDLWTSTLWHYQDMSQIPNTDDLYSRPTYLSTYLDRLSNMSPGLAPLCLQSAGSTITWDIGVAPPTLPCRADFNFDGHVSGVDLGMLLGSWGGANGDLTDDGIVNGADISELLGSWGACP